MANDLTGDFDVVAQFPTPTANRILAAMHRAERFPHSISMRVDDTPRGPKVHPAAISIVDAFGDATVNQDRVGDPIDVIGEPAVSNSLYAVLDAVVNGDLLGVHVDPIVPSHLKGRAQLQLFPPTIDVSDSSGSRITVRMDLLARYFPDKHTARLAEFVRGQLHISAPIAQMGSLSAQVVDIDFKSSQVTVDFTPTWSSRPLTAEDHAAINLLIRNALKSSFLPSNTVVPSRIRHLLFKTLPGPPATIAVLLNLGGQGQGGPGNPGSANRVFLGAGDDFAYAAGVDFIRKTFQPTLDAIVSNPIPPISILGESYTITINTATIALVAGRMVLTFEGRARTPASWLPDFDFVVRQTLTLAVDGATADFVVGQLSLHLPNDILNFIASPFKGAATQRIAQLRDQALEDAQAHQTVRGLLSAQENLGVFLNSLFAAPRRKPVPPRAVKLAYTAVDIQPSGVILHGSLGVQDWPPPRVEFELIPEAVDEAHFGGANVMDAGPDYSALRSWIPGGVIQQYEWHAQGQTQHFIDPNRFVLLHQGPLVSAGVAMRPAIPAYHPTCLTIRGTRLSASGPVVAEPVTATVCGYSSFPVFGGDLVNELLPMIALVERDPHGLVHVTGHTFARTDSDGAAVPNLLVHFGDERSAASIELLIDSLRSAGRDDGGTAVVVVLPPEQLRAARYVPGVTYADNHDQAWNALFGVKPGDGAVTLIAGPGRKVGWRHEGEIDREALGAALRNLEAGKPVGVRVLGSEVRIGQPPPNLLFEYTPGANLTLRKLSGQRAVLVFWKTGSQQSIDAVRDAQITEARGAQPPIVIAINDGETADAARRAAADHGLSASLLTDPDRQISRAYGVTVWPTIIDVDDSGVVTRIQYGRTGASRGVAQHV